MNLLIVHYKIDSYLYHRKRYLKCKQFETFIFFVVSYEVTNSQDIDNEVQENNVNVLRVQHNHRISTAVPQLLKRCTSYKVYNRSWAEEAAVSVGWCYIFCI